jgi:transposase
MAYAPEHEKELANQSYRRRMGGPRAPHSGRQQAGTSEDPRLAQDPRGYLLYVLRSGCPWRLLPREFPPWESVYSWFRKWRTDGTFERLNASLRERLRTRLGRNPLPSAGIADSQSAKSTGVGEQQRGYDANKKVRGRKRHLLVVDTRRVCSSKPRFTAPRWRSRTD